MDETISPELVLVCPELRMRAIAALPDPDWDNILARVRIRAAATEPAPAAPVWSSLVAPVVVSAAFFVAVVLATLTLTLVADAVR